ACGYKVLLAIMVVCVVPGVVQSQDLNDQIEKMTKDAAKKVAPSVVQIITQGGIDMVVTTPKGPVFRNAQRPTTGVVVAEVGYISATGRIWGKALQTDAKISPINYGGPMVDIEGRVQGILVPASPQGEDVTAGFEWYDSGIGFAIPMEDIMGILPRLKKGKDLKKGLLGFRMKSQDIYSSEPEIGEVMGDSSAAKAGLKPGDVIIEIEGKSVERMAQIQ